MTRIVLPPEAESASVARNFVSDSYSRWEISADVDAAQLVVSELVTNAVRNARSQVTVQLRLESDHVRLEVEDEDSRLPVMQQNSWDALGGRGLLLVDALSQRWGSELCPYGKVVWAELSLTG